MKAFRYFVPWLALAAAVAAVWLSQSRPFAQAQARPGASPAPAGPSGSSAEVHQPSPPALSPSPGPKEQLRGVWVPYMALEAPEHTQAAFEENFRAIAQSAQKKGLNTLFVHVRAFCDALYPSERYPWSHILTGVQGKDPGFDPLQFMVDYTHSLGMEFHAWVNPLRVCTEKTPGQLAGDSPYTTLGDTESYYFMEWEGTVYLDPAYPYTRTLVAEGAAEIVEKYPVDGVHFDDYFYPTQEASLDGESYQLYCDSVSQPLAQADWRRANISAMVEEVYQRVKAARPEARFGISPQGNLTNDWNMGADVSAWCALPGYVDYLCPQLYYGFEDPGLPYAQALEQWTALPRRQGLALYAGLALYKAGDPERGQDWAGGDVIGRQIDAAADWDGVVLYSSAYLDAEQTQEEMAGAVEAMARLS